MEQLESDVINNPYRLKSWITYVSYLDNFDPYQKFKVYERALKYLPRSYKLWFSYLNERERDLRGYTINDKGYDILIETYERSLVNMHKMPKIWQNYCKLLVKLCRGTTTRKAFDRALQSLPITQHQGIWDLYIKWIQDFDCHETSIKIFRRYLMFDPIQRENFVNYLEEKKLYNEAIKQLVICVDDPHYVSPLNSSRHQLWMRLCDLCASHADIISDDIRVEPIIRSGITKFSDEVGKLWGRLADYYVQQGLFDKARDIYEEALNSVVTVKDFTIVYDKYVKVEENLLTAKLQWLEELENEEMDSEETKSDVVKEKAELQQEIDVRLARIEYMLSKRPLLLNRVILRQNPHNVYEWLKRIKILRDQIKSNQNVKSSTDGNDDVENEMQQEEIAHTFAEAVKAIDPALAVGKFSHIWIAFAKFYERANDLDSARSIFRRATEVEYKSIEELANVWCAWAEMEIRCEKYEEALQVLQRVATNPPKLSKKAQPTTVDKTNLAVITSKDSSILSVPQIPVSHQIHKNVKIWGLYLDLEESIGTVDTCRAAYERVIDLKVVTPQMILNYASYLEEHHYFDDSFRVYEKAVTMFVYPQLRIIWLTYIDKFIARYGATKIERLRDMFENALSSVTQEYAPEFYIKYGKAEEELGLTRQAIAVYERATRAVGDKDRLNMYRLYARKTEQFYGVTKSRPVYERAIMELNENDSRVLCVEFAEMETRLGEIDRARAIYQYGSQFAPPSVDSTYWTKWKEFEEAHGSEDTYREMLRITRSVETAFSQVPLYMTPASNANTNSGQKRTIEDEEVISFLPEQKKQAL